MKQLANITCEPKLDVTISYMVMKQAPTKPIPLPTKFQGRYEIKQVALPSRDFYLFLYHQVGTGIGWYERKKMPPHELEAILHHPLNQLFVLYGDGAPKGYYEYDLRQPEIGSLAYFGLFPEACGLGLGSWFLAAAIAGLWQAHQHAKEIIVNSCTLDHPAALPLYQKHGFVIERQKTMTIDDPTKVAATLILP